MAQVTVTVGVVPQHLQQVGYRSGLLQLADCIRRLGADTRLLVFQQAHQFLSHCQFAFAKHSGCLGAYLGIAVAHDRK